MALYPDAGATLDDIREAVAMLEEIARTARRVLGSGHPFVRSLEISLRFAREALHARETMGDVSSLREAMEAMAAGDA